MKRLERVRVEKLVKNKKEVVVFEQFTVIFYIVALLLKSSGGLFRERPLVSSSHTANKHPTRR